MYVGFETEHYQPTSHFLDFRIDSYIQDAQKRVENLAQFIIGSYDRNSVLDTEAPSRKPSATYSFPIPMRISEMPST
jgi:hypothetical protein